MASHLKRGKCGLPASCLAPCRALAGIAAVPPTGGSALRGTTPGGGSARANLPTAAITTKLHTQAAALAVSEARQDGSPRQVATAECGARVHVVGGEVQCHQRTAGTRHMLCKSKREQGEVTTERQRRLASQASFLAPGRAMAGVSSSVPARWQRVPASWRGRPPPAQPEQHLRAASPSPSARYRAGLIATGSPSC